MELGFGLQFATHHRIAAVATAWDALEHGDAPFWRSGFLAALEASGSVTALQPGETLPSRAQTGCATGWTPVYLCVLRDGALVGAVAAYIKHHSYGEYIFDWAWAGAARRAGLPYYPKLVIAAPATPATGHRMLFAPGLAPELRHAVCQGLLSMVRACADAIGAHSIHWLFCTAAEQAVLAGAGYAPRASLQFHWHNQGYQTWDDFVATWKSRKRKQVRKERARAQVGLTFRWVRGDELDAGALAQLAGFYANTTENHGGRQYLTPAFFTECAQRMGTQMWMLQARSHADVIVAGALFFVGAQTLYGRYWGTDVEREFLHFETAYYQGIDYALAHGLQAFEAGAQGEHKLVRGFVPSPTYSAHWMRVPGLHAAVADFCVAEAAAVAAQMQELAAYLPYRTAADAEGEG